MTKPRVLTKILIIKKQLRMRMASLRKIKQKRQSRKEGLIVPKRLQKPGN